MVGVLTFAALFVDMAIDGVPRLDLGFLHQLPVAPRRRRRASCRPGSARLLVMLVTAFFAVPLGVAAGVYLEEYAPQELGHRHHRDQHHQPRRRAVDRLRPAGAGPVRLPVRPRPEHPVGGPDAGAAHPADRDRRHARGDPRDSAGASAKAPTRSARRSGRSCSDHILPYSLGRHPDRRDHRPGARHRRDRADHHHRRADLHRLPAAVAGQGRAAVPVLRVADLAVHGDADPDVQLDLAARRRRSRTTRRPRASCWC